jgi:hypothetical protein
MSTLEKADRAAQGSGCTYASVERNKIESACAQAGIEDCTVVCMDYSERKEIFAVCLTPSQVTTTILIKTQGMTFSVGAYKEYIERALIIGAEHHLSIVMGELLY